MAGCSSPMPRPRTRGSSSSGTHFFGDASHRPVQYQRDPDVPLTVRATTLEPAPLDAVLVYGEGALPPELEGHVVVGTSGRWRRVERR
jgi:hypothetical protein